MPKIHSQAYNFGGFVQREVDPGTSQYTCSISLYKAPASVRNCPAFNLTLSYNPLNNKDIGLGEGWALNLPSYEHGKSGTLLLSSGEHDKVEETPNGLTAKDQKLKNLKTFTSRKEAPTTRSLTRLFAEVFMDKLRRPTTPQ
ncbi:hypothetical protein TWF106_001712 [Orbilia oligospora]|uniref:Uncharacterized protein n=1 Tax=Orbilia oligospora TaxID=2813651 RepID=A0A7C8V1S8_ORBOL|nr:hypothetical protein TWF106_001712 [Orbilia oligospora]